VSGGKTPDNTPKRWDYMRIKIVGRQMEVPKDFFELADKKLSKYDKFFNDDAIAIVTLRKRKTGKEILELTITSSGLMFRGEEEDSTFQNALDSVMESIEKQIRKNKTKLEKRLRNGVFPKEIIPEEIPEDAVTATSDAPVRIKEFVLKPMSVDEAILQMNMLGHQFFVFLDQDTSKVCVVYERKDGKYGLIIPKTE
jgi:putative sigma-54 modulation protein